MKTKVLMVCLGNICRSPLAEGILKSKIDNSKIMVDSAGTGGWHAGEQPDIRSITVAKKHGLDISSQRARQFSTSDFEDFDHIFVMDISNEENVLKMTQSDNDRQKVQLILNEIFPSENVDVPDPYWDEEQGFEKVFQMLDKACDVIAGRL